MNSSSPAFPWNDSIWPNCTKMTLAPTRSNCRAQGPKFRMRFRCSEAHGVASQAMLQKRTCFAAHTGREQGFEIAGGLCSIRVFAADEDDRVVGFESENAVRILFERWGGRAPAGEAIVGQCRHFIDAERREVKTRTSSISPE